MDNAIHTQDILSMIYLHRTGVKWNTHYAYAIAATGNIMMLKYLKETGWKFNEDILYIAIHNGHIPAVKYLLDNGCPIRFGKYAKSLNQNQYEYTVVLEITRMCNTFGHYAKM